MKDIMKVAIGTIVGNGIMLAIGMLAYKPLSRWTIKVSNDMVSEFMKETE